MMPEATKKIISIDRSHQFCNENLLFKRNFRKLIVINVLLAVFVSATFNVIFVNLDLISGGLNFENEEIVPGKKTSLKRTLVGMMH